MNSECVREDLYVEGRRYRRFVYAGSTTVFDHTSETLSGRKAVAPPIREKKGKGKKEKNESSNDAKYTLDNGAVVQEKGRVMTSVSAFPMILKVQLEDLQLSSVSFLYNSINDGECTLVLSAKHRSELEFGYQHVCTILKNARDVYTHFLSIPLHMNSTARNSSKFDCSEGAEELQRMAETVCTDLLTQEPSIRRTSHIGDLKYHITLFLVSILSDAELKRVRAALSSIGSVIYDRVGGASIPLSVGGVHYFGKEAKIANIVYLKIAESGKPGMPTAGDQIPTGNQGNQTCPRIARVVSVLADVLEKCQVLSVPQRKKQQLGAEGVHCGVAWHMTLFNGKYDRGGTMDVSNLNYNHLNKTTILRAPCVQ